MMLFIRNLSKSCGMEVYRVEKSMSEWKLLYGLLSDLEFLSIHILLTPVWLVFLLQYFSSPVLITVSILVYKLDSSFVVHLLEQTIKQCFTGDLCSLGVQYR